MLSFCADDGVIISRQVSAAAVAVSAITSDHHHNASYDASSSGISGTVNSSTSLLPHPSSSSEHAAVADGL